MPEFKFFRTPPIDFNNPDAPIKVETMYVHTSPESEEKVVNDLNEAYVTYYREVRTFPEKLVLGTDLYEQYVGYESRIAGGMVFPLKFRGMEIIIVEAPIMEFVGSAKQQFARLGGRRRK